MNRSASFVAAAFSLSIFSACGSTGTETLPPPSEVCAGHSAEIQVFDGLIQRLCGCAEGKSEPSAGPIDCTVDKNSVVFFHFLGDKLDHQLIPTDGTSSFAALPLCEAK